MKEKTNKLTVYLLKPEFTEFADVVRPNTQSIDIPDVGALYLESSHPGPPEWLAGFFKNKFTEQLKEFRLLTASAKALLLVKVPDGEHSQIFALAFGFGRYLMRDDVFEERFGLKVVLNSVAEKSLRSIDKTTLGSVPKQSREQISKESPAGNFGIDVEQDLVSAVTGKSKLPEFGRTISGKDAFAASVKINVDNLPGFLEACLRQYRSNAYKAEFDWIDQIAEVRAQSQIAKLDKALIDKIAAGDFDHIWMVPPEIVDWADIKGFKYGQRKRGQLVTDLDVPSLIETADDDALTIDWFKKTNVFLISARTDDMAASWTAYRCLYAEIESEGAVCVLNGGKWYSVSANFTQQVKDAFAKIPDAQIDCLEYDHENEAAYNKALAGTLTGSHCLDADLIHYGGGKSSIEFCDILTNEKKLLHVKRYSGSAQLSHLFSQGAVSGELFASDPAFRNKLNEKLADGHKLDDPQKRPNPEDYEIVFAIISKSDNPLEIPFFSKVSLRNTQRRLAGYGYKVSKKKIQVKASA